MRPSYRFAAVVGVVVLAASAVGVLWLGNTRVEHAEPVHVPLEVEKAPTASSGPPSAETVEEMLDRVEAAEVERFGAAEAARRRRTRDQLIEGRLHRTDE